MLAHLTIPRTDAFSFTKYGAPWIDFEWGTQLVWYAVHALGGMWGLWLLRGVCVALAFWPVDGLLREKGASDLARAGALGLWLAAMVAQTDLRADLTSAMFFAVLLRRLERGRASFLFGFALFAVWANLHAGFILGFGLYAWAALNGVEGVGAEATGAAFGGLLNPYGAGLYHVLLVHASDPAVRSVMEWKPPTSHNPFQLALLAAILGTLIAAGLSLRRASRFLLGVAFVLLCASIFSARFGAYFAPAGAMLVFTALPRPRAAVVAAVLAVLTGLMYPLRVRLEPRPYSDLIVARRAVDFIAKEKDTLGGLRLFNTYEWGGYLGWKLGPDGRVFGDGRYLFHSQLPEINDALTSAEKLADFAAKYQLDGFLIRRLAGTTFPMTRRYPDGKTQTFERPWYITYLPRSRWALVYWDDQALVFVDRAKVPAVWLASHEYRWLLPGDDAARADALSRHEIPGAALDAEAVRHAAEVTDR